RFVVHLARLERGGARPRDGHHVLVVLRGLALGQLVELDRVRLRHDHRVALVVLVGRQDRDRRGQVAHLAEHLPGFRRRAGVRSLEGGDDRAEGAAGVAHLAPPRRSGWFSIPIWLPASGSGGFRMVPEEKHAPGWPVKARRTAVGSLAGGGPEEGLPCPVAPPSTPVTSSLSMAADTACCATEP